jgi:hypothetical protein
MLSPTAPAPESEDESEDDGLSLSELRRQYTDYVSVKAPEVEESREASRYYHSAQITDAQRKVLRERGQPEIIFDRISRKIDGLVGVVQKMRNDPKAFPRTQAHEQGAELATVVLRYVLDNSSWEDIERECVKAASVHGIGVAELGLEPGDNGDPDITIADVDSTTFFYDPRSLKPDFSDARYMGVSRFASEEEIEELFPDKAGMVFATDEGGDYTTFDTDKAVLWVNSKRKLRLVEHWYKFKGEWRYCIYISTTKLAGGPSPFVDDRGKSICRYFAWCNQVDHDGDRYGFVRRLKGPQDAINQHRSKAMHIMNTRQIFARRGVFQDIQKARREAARPDGIVEYDGSRDDFSIEQPAQEFLQQTQYFQDAKDEIENFGPSPALIGTGVDAKSGRALAMMQQAGVAELGPFLGHYRAWKIRIYRAMWANVRKHWQAERYVRVTDDEGFAQFIAVNKMQIGPDGFPQIINQLGALDVDIILDEGPDTTNVLGDVFDTMLSLAQNKAPIPPQALIELSPLPKSQKDKILKMIQPQPDPMQQAAAQLQMAGAQAKVAETEASAQLKQAQALKAMYEAGMSGQQGQPGPSPFEMNMQANETAASVQDTLAAADLKRAQTAKTLQEIQLAPQKMAQDAQMKREQAFMRNRQANL